MGAELNTANNPDRNTAKTFVGAVTADDPCKYEQLVQPWELINTPVERGTFGYRMQYLRTPAITLYREQFDLECRLQGLSPAGVFVLSVPVRLGACSRYWGSQPHDTGFPFMLPGGLDVEIDSGQDQILLLVNLSLLRSHTYPETYNSIERASQSHLLSASAGEIMRFGKWLMAILDAAGGHPESYQSLASARSLEEDILSRLANAIRRSCNANKTIPDSKRQQALERALEFLRETDITNITIPELSDASGASLRTLEYAFRHRFNTTPLGFLRANRLHAARRALMAACTSDTTVVEIACRFGFYQPGQFTMYYRRRFGELPSRTLKTYYGEMGNGWSPLATPFSVPKT